MFDFQIYQDFASEQHNLKGLRHKKAFFDSKFALLRRVQQYLGCLPWWPFFHWPATCKKVLITLGPLGPEVEVSRSHTVSDRMYADIKIIFVSLL